MVAGETVLGPEELVIKGVFDHRDAILRASVEQMIFQQVSEIEAERSWIHRCDSEGGA